MINAEELAICKRRGHQPDAGMGHGRWVQCQACGMWLREVMTVEEREDDPPENEIGLFTQRRREGKIEGGKK